MESLDEFCNEIYRIAHQEKVNIANGYGLWILSYITKMYGEDIANRAITAYDCVENPHLIENFLEFCYLTEIKNKKLKPSTGH